MAEVEGIIVQGGRKVGETGETSKDEFYARF